MYPIKRYFDTTGKFPRVVSDTVQLMNGVLGVINIPLKSGTIHSIHFIVLQDMEIYRVQDVFDFIKKYTGEPYANTHRLYSNICTRLDKFDKIEIPGLKAEGKFSNLWSTLVVILPKNPCLPSFKSIDTDFFNEEALMNSLILSLCQLPIETPTTINDEISNMKREINFLKLKLEKLEKIVRDDAKLGEYSYQMNKN